MSNKAKKHIKSEQTPKRYTDDPPSVDSSAKIGGENEFVFNENWKKLSKEDREFAENNFAQLTAWKKRRFRFKNSILQDLFQETGTRYSSLKGFYHLFILGLAFFLISHPIVIQFFQQQQF